MLSFINKGGDTPPLQQIWVIYFLMFPYPDLYCIGMKSTNIHFDSFKNKFIQLPLKHHLLDILCHRNSMIFHI